MEIRPVDLQIQGRDHLEESKEHEKKVRDPHAFGRSSISRAPKEDMYDVDLTIQTGAYATPERGPASWPNATCDEGCTNGTCNNTCATCHTCSMCS